MVNFYSECEVEMELIDLYEKNLTESDKMDLCQWLWEDYPDVFKEWMKEDGWFYIKLKEDEAE